MEIINRSVVSSFIFKNNYEQTDEMHTAKQIRFNFQFRAAKIRPLINDMESERFAYSERIRMEAIKVKVR